MAHHTVRLISSPYLSAPDLLVAGFVPKKRDDAELQRLYAGRATLSFDTGPFALHTSLTAADLRPRIVE